MRQDPHAEIHLAQLGCKRSAPENQPIDPELHAVDIYAPWCASFERQLRIRVHRARDIAQARACRSKHGRARSLYWMAAQMAGDWVFRRAPNEDLEEILAALSRLFLVAGATERLEAPDEW